MMIDDGNREIRSSLKRHLIQLWDACGQAGRYVADDPTMAVAACPDLEAALDRLAPSAEQLMERQLEGGTLAGMSAVAQTCTQCQLSRTRNHVVFGEGVLNPRVMIIGEGPGADEDMQGRPFVGRAGQYLDTWLSSISLDRSSSVYIANIVKCRPPGNRNPFPEEAASCLPYLHRQIALVKPEAILCVGLIAAQYLLQKTESLHEMRGKFHRYRTIPVVVTYHPAGVLRKTEYRPYVWEDLKRLAAFLRLDIKTARR